MAFKIIHTSDWHLGQHFFTRQRKNEHEQFLAWLVAQVEHHNVDAIIVAGDIYDTSAPPSYARELYNQFVVDMQRLDCQLVLLAGNHDSVSVLNESKTILKHLNTDVITRPATDLSDEGLPRQLLMLQDRNGQPGAIIAAVPFIRPADIITSKRGETGLQKRQNLGEAIAAHYVDLFKCAEQYRQQQALPIPIVMTGHLAAVGVTQSESVRDIYIGSLDGFPVSGFPQAEYIALGHIHKAQCLNAHKPGIEGESSQKTETIYYSGSPIPLSFDELQKPKSVNLVSFEKAELKSVEQLQVPVFQAMKLIKGDLQTIETQIQALPKDQSIWLSVQIQAQDFLSDLQERIQTMIQDSQLEVLQLTRSRQHNKTLASGDTMESLSELTAMQVFERRLALEVFETEEQQHRVQRLKQHFRRIEQDVLLDQAQEPSAEEIEPSAAEINPSAEEIEPSAAEINPSAEEIEPSAAEINPSAAETKPLASEDELSIADKESKT